VFIYAGVRYIAAVKTLPHQVRIPDDIYAELYKIKHLFEQSLEPQKISNAPSLQDMVNVALKRLIKDWQDPEQQILLRDELLEQRSVARSNMGRRKPDST
jgi:hypothetical protein